MRKTKIVATIGTASNNAEVLRKMITAGVDIIRLNFSHGTNDEKKETVKLVRQLAKEEKRIVGVLVDLQGPKIRISKFKNDKVFLQDNSQFILDASLADGGDERAVGIDYKNLPQDVKPEDILLLDDGAIVLVVKKVEGTKIICEVKVGGELSNNKGINRQGGGLSAGSLTEKDREDLKFAIALNAEYVAISFVRSRSDIIEIKGLITKEKGAMGVIAKIERIEAIVPEVLRGIIISSDGIMVARGDLGVEIGDAKVPAAQKVIIDTTITFNKPVITATQMMETMIHNVTPTRAEVSDVANAVLEGTDAVMLSAETASGDHPVLVVQTMDRLCTTIEQDPEILSSSYWFEKHFNKHFDSPDEALPVAAMYMANRLDIKAIISITETGKTALLASRMRSGTPVYGFSRNSTSLGKMALYHNVYPIEFDATKFKNNYELRAAAVNKLKEDSHVKSGDLVVITYADTIVAAGGTNSLTLHIVD